MSIELESNKQQDINDTPITYLDETRETDQIQTLFFEKMRRSYHTDFHEHRVRKIKQQQDINGIPITHLDESRKNSVLHRRSFGSSRNFFSRQRTSDCVTSQKN